MEGGHEVLRAGEFSPTASSACSGGIWRNRWRSLRQPMPTAGMSACGSWRAAGRASRHGEPGLYAAPGREAIAPHGAGHLGDFDGFRSRIFGWLSAAPLRLQPRRRGLQRLATTARRSPCGCWCRGATPRRCCRGCRTQPPRLERGLLRLAVHRRLEGDGLRPWRRAELAH
ncbi:MAG: hypothetical protein ACLUEK_12105 [Oscillospiraceae bacterium]